MLTIYLLRHGETAWNADGNRYCGRTDLKLTEKGLRQARAVQEKLKGTDFDAVYSSPLIRAKHTAEIAANRDDVITDERLIEADFGEWEGKIKQDFIAEDPTLWKAWKEDPTHVQAGGTGETAGALVKRGVDFFDFILEKHREGRFMVVAHNGFNRLFLSYKLGMPLKNYQKLFMDNSSINMFTLDDQGEIVLKSLNK